MFWKKKIKPHAVTSVVGEDLEIRGDVIFNGGLQVNGLINGNISAKGETDTRSSLSLHRSGKIVGNVNVPFLVLDGEVEGNVICRKFLVIEKNCRIEGDVHYLSLNMAPGAVVTGRIRHVPEGLMIENKEPNARQRSAAKTGDSE